MSNKFKQAALALILIVAAYLGFNHQQLTQITDIFNGLTSNSTASETEVTFVKHVDGDTSKFKINGQVKTVRYLLIDTPETVKPNTPVQLYGKEASDFTKNALSHAHKIQLDFDKTGNQGDKYNRTLAYVYVDGKDLNEELVKNGLARVAYTYKANIKNKTKYLKAQEYAKSHHLGIWSKPGYVTERGYNMSTY